MIKSILHALVSKPLVYSMCQATLGAGRVTQRVGVFAQDEHGLVLDVGANRGYAKRLWPADARYVPLDLDPTMLRAGRVPLAIQGDATQLPLLSDCIDMALCKQVSHHIPDAVLDQMFEEIVRVLKPGGWFVFMDAVRTPRAASKLMWRYDRGAHPRWEPELREYIDRYFEVRHREQHWKLHLYVVYLLVPKSAPSVTTAGAEAAVPQGRFRGPLDHAPDEMAAGVAGPAARGRVSSAAPATIRRHGR